MSNELARIFGVLEVDYETARPLLRLLETSSYDQALAELLETEKFSDEEWKAAARTHHLVVAWRPETAHEWLTMVVTRLCSEECRWIRQGLHQGSILGLLEAGVWLDEDLYQTEFQTTLLVKLAELVCSGKPRKLMRLPHGGRDVDYAGLHKRLAHAMTMFLFPEKTTHILVCEGDPAPVRPELSEKEMEQRRTDETKAAVQYLHEHLGAGKLTEFAKLFIERLTHSLLARKTPAEKVAAIGHIL